MEDDQQVGQVTMDMIDDDALGLISAGADGLFPTGVDASVTDAAQQNTDATANNTDTDAMDVGAAAIAQAATSVADIAPDASANEVKEPEAPASVPGRGQSNSPKRPRLGVQVYLEPRIDAQASIHEVFADGTYTPVSNSHFLRASAAASTFVSRALAAPHVDHVALARQVRALSSQTENGVASAARAQGLSQSTENPAIKSTTEGVSAADERRLAEPSAAGSSGVPAESARESSGAKSATNANGALPGQEYSNDTSQQASPLDAPSWPSLAITPVEGALAEMERVISVIDAMRGPNPLLELKRYTSRSSAKTNDNATTGSASGHPNRDASAVPSTLPAETLRKGKAMLMAKSDALKASADLLNSRVEIFREWAQRNRGYVDACVELRKHCGALRRSSDGTPMVDIGDGDFTAIERSRTDGLSRKQPSLGVHGLNGVGRDEPKVGSEAQSGADNTDAVAEHDGDTAAKTNAPLPAPCTVYAPPQTVLSYSVHVTGKGVGAPLSPSYADVRQDGAPETIKAQRKESGDVQAVMRSIRLARLSVFRRTTFERLLREAGLVSNVVDITTNTVSMDCRPSHVVTVQRTMRYSDAPETCLGNSNADAEHSVAEPAAEAGSRVLACVTGYATIRNGMAGALRSPELILPQLESTVSDRCTRAELEKTLDDAAALLRVSVKWSRGPSAACEICASVYASAADGDGPSRLLVQFEPWTTAVSDASPYRGHIRVTPAFGAIVASPDESWSRLAAPAGPSQLLPTGYTPYGSTLDDIPRAYVCPIGSGEVSSVITLLLCVRLLDAMEALSRSSEALPLDVDRQCFSVIVVAPKTNRSLRAKVWPYGPEAGAEIPAVSVWIDDVQDKTFPECSGGRLRAWRRRLALITTSPADDDAPGGDVAAGEDANTGAAAQSEAPSAFPFAEMNGIGMQNGNGWGHMGQPL